MKLSFKIVPLVAAMAMAGCATKPPVTDGPDTEAYARKIIIEKVDAAVLAQRELAEATAEHQQMLLRRQAALDADEVDIDYMGQPQPLLESIAHRYGYKYVETGKRADLKTVNLRVQRQKVVEVLRDVSYQIDGGADVVLDKDGKVIRLIYKNARS